MLLLASACIRPDCIMEAALIEPVSFAAAKLKRVGLLFCGRSALLACLLVSLLLHAVPGAAHATGEAAADRIRAAYILKFLEYVEWPEAAFSDPTVPYVIGVTSSDYVANELARLVPTRTSSGRSIVVKRVAPGSTPADVHALYVSRQDPAAARLARAYAGKPVLIVTDEDTAPEASIINFVPVDRRVRFEISLANAEKAGLRLSSRLLSVAVRVHKGERPGDTDLADATMSPRLPYLLALAPRSVIR